MTRAEAEELAMLALDLHDQLQQAGLDEEHHGQVWRSMAALLQFSNEQMKETKC